MIAMLIPFLFCLYVLLTIGVLAFGTGNGSWRQRDGRQDTITFRVPTGRRVGLVMFIPILFIGLPLTSRGVEHMVGVTLDCLGALGLLIIAGPNELQIDLRRRTYRYAVAPPLFVTTGSLDGLAGASVVGFGNAQYLVVLRRGPGNRGGFLVGMFSNKVKAEDMVQKLNAQLGLHAT